MLQSRLSCLPFSLLAALAVGAPASAQQAARPIAAARSVDSYAGETKAQRDARMHWWRQARFGMFIHWGLYSVPAGVYQHRPH